MSDWPKHRGICDIDINYLKDKIAHNIAYNSIQYKRFNRRAYKAMIIKIVSKHLDEWTYKEIGEEVGRSPERIRQILAKFYRRVRYIIQKEKNI